MDPQSTNPMNSSNNQSGGNQDNDDSEDTLAGLETKLNDMSLNSPEKLNIDSVPSPPQQTVNPAPISPLPGPLDSPAVNNPEPNTKA